MIRLFYVKDNYIVAQEKQEPVMWGNIQGDISGNTQLQEVFDNLQNDINTNVQGITDEIQSRIDGDTNLQNQIDDNKAAIEQEETDRKDADKSLQDAIELEQTTRETADGVLNNKITTINTNISENYYKKTEVDSKIDIIVAGEASLQNYYTKAESDNKYALKGEAPTNIYTKEQVDNKLSNKADKSEIPTIPLFRTINGQAITGDTTNIVIEGGSGADLTNYYTKTESDNKYALKGDIPSDYYTKTQVDNKLANKQDTLVSGQNIKTINGQSIVGNGNITIEGGGSGADMSNYYTKSESDNKLSNKLDTTAYTRVIVDTELSSASTNPVQNRIIAIKLAELQAQIDNLKPSDDVFKVTFMSSTDKGAEVKPTYTVTYNNTTITTSNSEMYVAKDVTMTVVPSDIDGLVTPVAQTKKITEDTTFNFEYNGEALPVGTGRITFRTTSDNYTANVVNDSSKLTSMVIDNVTIPLEQSGVTNYTFANAGLHTGTYSLKDGETNGYQGLFTNCDELEEVTVPEGVTALTGAFSSCINLKTISLPETLVTIGNDEFKDCENLTGITIPDNVTSIGTFAFDGCSYLKNVDFGENLETIGDYAFQECWQLRKVELKDRVKTIGNYAFITCPSITGITIGSACESIGSNSFYGAPSAQYVKINGANVQTIGSNVFSYNGSNDLYPIYVPNGTESSYRSYWGSNYSDRIKSVVDMPIYSEPTAEDITYIRRNDSADGTMRAMEFEAYLVGKVDTGKISEFYSVYGSLPKKGIISEIRFGNSVTNLLENVLKYESGLTSITIGNGVTSIGSGAFSSCSALTSITIPDSVTSIGSGAFSSCSALTSITIGNGVTSIDSSTFNSCSSITGITIPDNVTSIGTFAFDGCSYLKNVDFGENLETIGDYAFGSCSSITSITIPDSVTSIGGYAFYNCSALTSITIGNGVTSIGSGAFSSCSALTSITIGNGVTSIGSSTFNSCSSITSITIKALTPPTIPHYTIPSNVTAIYVPYDSADAYKSADGWSNYASKIQAIQE